MPFTFRSIRIACIPLHQLRLAAFAGALVVALLTAACSPMPAEDAAAPDAPTAAVAVEDAATAPVEAEDAVDGEEGEDAEDAADAADAPDADDLAAAEAETIAKMQLVGDAVAKGVITVDEGTLFLRVHGLIHAPGAEGADYADMAAEHHGDDEGELDMDAMKAWEQELLAQAVKVGTITQEDADGFDAVHAKLEAAGLLEEEH